MKKHLLIICLFVAVQTFGQAIRLSEEPEKFIKDLETAMSAANNVAAVASQKRFAEHWNSFGQNEKKMCINICRSMAYKGAKTPQFYTLFEDIHIAISQENYPINQLLEPLQKSAETSNAKQMTLILERLFDFFKTRLLYSSNFNRLYARGGKYRFRFLEKETPYFEGIKNVTQENSEKSILDEWDKSATIADQAIELPLMVGFVIDFEKTNLTLATATDSIKIEQTTGGVSWHNDLWVGKQGQVRWQMPATFAEVESYSFLIRNPFFVAEKAVLHYEAILENPVKGVLEFKGGSQAAYPRFKSYEANTKIKGLHPSITYHGGISLMGKQILSSSFAKKLAEISVHTNDTLRFKAQSSQFILSDSLLSADKASFVTYIDGDSIVNATLKLAYYPQKGWLNAQKIGKGHTNFADSYHKLEIHCDAMRWSLPKKKMDFYILSSKEEVPAIFESFNYYAPRKIQRLSGDLGFNPLVVASNYMGKTGQSSFVAQDLTTLLNRSPEVSKSAFVYATEEGYFDYNAEQDRFRMSRKGKHYILAQMGKVDYDDFIIPSIYNNTDSIGNATLDFQRKELIIRGTKRFALSDSLGIFAYPVDKLLRFRKNRTFSINGTLKVRNFRFVGKEFEIDYDNFVVKLDKIEAISFVPQNLYKNGGKIEVGGGIHYENGGVLYLNRPDNKSGKKNLAEFPRLVIKKGVRIYFPAIYDEKVYFDVPTIDHDSLTTTDPAWAGKFYSEGIFPPFEEIFTVMPDTSLGFSHHAKSSYKIYKEPSFVTFDSNLIMDKKGMHTSGKLSHISAELEAENIAFFTDSLLANGKKGKINELKQKSYFPAVSFEDYTACWKPSLDSMKIKSSKTFALYGGQLSGEVLLGKKELLASGKLERGDSQIQSNLFSFKPDGFLADTAQFNIKSLEANTAPVLVGKNVSLDFNTQKNMVLIGQEENTSIEFPYAAYKTTIDNAQWDIAGQKITMKGDVENAIFTSTNPVQLGLNFHAESAIYDNKATMLKLYDVPFIQSADAKIIPQKGEVVIQRNAEMLPFTHAELTIDTLNAYHHLVEGNIKIHSKKKFSGDATYKYTNISGEVYAIKMGNFEWLDLNEDDKKEEFSTVARAKINEKDNLFLSAKMLYKGEMTMVAPQKNLYLDGVVRPQLQNLPQLGGYWIPYKGNKSEEILIGVNESLESNDKRLWAGLHLKHDVTQRGLYPSFLSPKYNDDDQNIFLATGTLRRDEPNKSFVIDGENRYELREDEKLTKLEGNFQFVSGKVASKIQTVGYGEICLDTTIYDFNTMMLLDLPMSPALQENMAQKIIKTNLEQANSEPAILHDSPEFLGKIGHLIGAKKTQEYQAKTAIEHFPLPKFMPEKFAKSLVLSELNLKWNPVINAFYSVGKIGISNIGEVDINARIEGYFEIIKNPIDGDEIYIFLEVSEDNWYFIGTKAGEIGFLSSDDAFNKLITAKDNSTKKYDVFAIEVADAMQYRKRFLEMYRGGIPKSPKKEQTKKEESKKEGF